MSIIVTALQFLYVIAICSPTCQDDYSAASYRCITVPTTDRFTPMYSQNIPVTNVYRDVSHIPCTPSTVQRLVSMEVTRSRLPNTGIGVIGNFIDEVRIRINRIKYMYGGGFTGNSTPYQYSEYQLLLIPTEVHSVFHLLALVRPSSGTIRPHYYLDPKLLRSLSDSNVRICMSTNHFELKRACSFFILIDE
jgi:hypothetical protein